MNDSADKLLENISIVLVKPTAAGNIGSTARAMANFGFRSLILVSPRPFDIKLAESFACNGAEILSKIKTVTSLTEAVKDASAVIGMTRRTRSKEHSVPVGKAASTAIHSALSGSTYIVFGCERSGLTKEEKDSCSVLSHIETVDGGAGSLNLSHAALLVMHEIYRNLHAKTTTGSECSGLLESFERLCSLQKRYDPGGRVQKVFRSAITRAELNRDEVNKLKKFFAACAARTMNHDD